MYIESKGNFINGEWKEARGECFKSYSPVNGELLWKGNKSIEVDVQLAIDSAKEASKLWSGLSLEERIKYLEKYVDVLKENKEELAKAISYEVGKPLWEAITEVNSMISKLEPCIESFELRNQTITRELANGSKSITKFKPHGVVAIIGPYNFPGHMPNGHILAALLAGNTIVLKPSEKVPFASEKVMELWEKAELPYGVINMVQGDKVTGESLCTNSEINGVFFTGSKKSGQRIEELCLHKKICALEMGGNSPLIVWDTSNIDGAVIATIQSSFITSGQRCSSARRLIVPNNDFGEKFLQRLVQITKKIKIGKVEDIPEPFMGPMKSKELADNVISKQNNLIQNGAKVLLESRKLRELGDAYITPGIIDVTQVWHKEDEEIIGPFIQVTRVDDFEQAIESANDTCYGLAAGIFTEDKKIYDIFEKNIKAGIINWNQQLTGASKLAPFGGIKDSGNYRPSGFLATDYCVYAVASIEMEKIEPIDTLPKGINLY